MSMPLALMCAEVIRRTGAEVVNSTVTDRQVRIIFRVPKGSGTRMWLSLMKKLLVLSRSSPWTLDLSKQYFLIDGSEEDMRHAWRVIVQGEGLGEHDRTIANSLKSVQVVGARLEEVPLYGSPNRSPTAGLYGHVPVGRKIS